VVAASDIAEPEAHRRFAFGLERLVFFPDAVFAIAITLLAIDIRLPALDGPVSNDAVVGAIRGLAPDLFAFTISFVVIAVFWVGHYRTFRWVARIDGGLIAVDMVFLFIIASLPFPTSVVARYGDLPAGAILYALFVVAGGLVAALLWVYPMRIAGLGVASVTPDIVRRVTWRTLVVPAVFAASIPVALVDPTAAELVWVLALPLQAIVSRRLRLSLTLGDVAIGRDEASG
jgi:uncharacterized membrane protein